ncbi:LytR/AlgR family response regulator transcription factor [Geojedonia litorea]|uniref:LytR/AlgR family response regulator transcription factor n=1 Tax=Geojedonia litorea TaxID=1268269 RepID=A0ABV9N807_9FLAO
MNNPFKILIVEDNMIIGARISMLLSNCGYEITGLLTRGEDVLTQIKDNKPDIILMDIQLHGELDGIATALLIQKEDPIPIIYLTANSDEAHFEKAKATNPYAFISKPFKKLDLKRAVELTVNRILTENKSQNTSFNSANHVVQNNSVISESIYVKHHQKMIKIALHDILYIEADRNYCKIYTPSKDHIVVMTLKGLTSQLPASNFLRIHRSYVVNLHHIQEVETSHVVISKKAIPLSKTYRSELLARLQTID